MEFDKKVKLYELLKEEFNSATGLSEYGSWEEKWDLDDDYSDDEDILYVNLELIDKSTDEERKIYLFFRASFRPDGESLFTEINIYDDTWEEWNSFEAYHISYLWRQMFFKALEV